MPSFPFQLSFLFASRSLITGQVLGIVYRVISLHLVKKAGYSQRTAGTGAITLIHRVDQYTFFQEQYRNVNIQVALFRRSISYRQGWPALSKIVENNAILEYALFFGVKLMRKICFIVVVGLVACSGISEEEVDQNINIVLNAIESKISNSEALEVICFGYEKSEVDVQGCYDFNIGIHYRIGETSSTQKELKEVYGITRCESAPDKYLLGKITYSSKDIKISCNMALAK